MKIEVLQEELIKGLALVLRAVSNRAQLPVLSAIKIEAGVSELILSATDLEIGMRVVVPAKVSAKGIIAVPAKTFNELLLTLKPGKLLMELVENNLLLKMGNFKGKVLIIDAAEFPQLPNYENSLIEVMGTELSNGVSQVSFASARDSLRPVLTGVLLEISQHLRLVATDGFRLSVATVGIKGSSATNTMTLLLPGRAMLEVSKIMKEGLVKIAYLPESKQVLFSNDSILFISQVIEGNFPDYTKILPKSFEIEAKASREELLSAVKTIIVFARDNSNMMRWSVGEDRIVITSNSNLGGEGVVEVQAKLAGEAVEVVFNAKYVADYLTLLSGDDLYIGLGGKLQPGMFAESETKRDTSFYIVMPINA